MTEPRRVRRTAPQHVVGDDVAEITSKVLPHHSLTDTTEMLTREYLNTKHMLDRTTERLNELKKALSDIVDKEGQQDEKGNMWMTAGEHQCKREKRLSVSLDEKRAEEWARSIGIWDEVKVVTEKLDLDKLMATCWENTEYREIIDGMFQEKVTWAFKVIEGKKDYYEE